MNNIFQHLPRELINKVLEYDGSVRFRKGKYMNQIKHDDDRIQYLREHFQKIMPPVVVLCEDTRFLIDIEFLTTKYNMFVQKKEENIVYSFFKISIDDGIQHSEYIRS